MPEPVRRDQRYMPGLDGLRAVAVLGVIAYHLGFAWLPGGLLGVGVFFTLSGYLITDLLLGRAAGGIRLTAFWLARARRLLPALLVMLVVVMAWVTVVGPHQPGDFRVAALTAGLYVNNWWLILHDVSYFQAFAGPQPLNHLWSLSVEEQFYLVWPFALMLGIRRAARAGDAARGRLLGATLVAALASIILMAVLYHPGLDPSRVYYGTDTRAFELLAGAALAMVWPSRGIRADIALGARRIIDAAGAGGLLVIAVLFLRTGEFSPFLYRGGFVLLSLATVLVLAAVTHPASRLAPLLGCRTLRWIGERSYGVYLWHVPVVVLSTPRGAHGTDVPRAILQLAITFVLAALSWRFVENPIRNGALGRLRADAPWRRWQHQPVPGRAWATLGVGTFVLTAALSGLAGAGVERTEARASGGVLVAQTVTAASVRPDAERTACTSVVHIGDSTSEGLVSRDYLPRRRQRIAAQYARVGATTQHFEIQGGRSIYERFEGQPNAQEVASNWRRRGFRGCWVLALGTNEAANVAAGSAVGLDARIDRMMSTIGDQPVLWVDVKSLVAEGPYAEANMEAFDQALVRACARYPSMRIYDWAADVQDAWFIADGIHFTTAGYAARSRAIARALLRAFPADGRVALRPGASCIVRPGPPAAAALSP